jgi:hypothetical protein
MQQSGNSKVLIENAKSDTSLAIQAAIYIIRIYISL